MKHYYYSEVLNKYSEDEALLIKEEKEYLEKKKAEAKAKEEAEVKRKEEQNKRSAAKAVVDEAFKKAYELRNNYVKKYGSYVFSINQDEKLLEDLISTLFS